ncbi:uncharacterized protein BJX67DRAFT_390487 [Aspergillus lucknowensis]|uniref:Uncharacterized protein n=1 Tax=Aspergillus lucknowensis TaxID=176173 RepID=A0ABR4M1K6_9EURO
MPSPKHRYRPRKHRAFHPPPLFWDNLSRLWLTKSSLREANRRYRQASSRQDSSPYPYTFAPDFLRTCSTTCLQEIRKFSRCGGPDLSDIRNHPAPSNFNEYSMDPTSSNSAPPTAYTETKPKNTTVYDKHFEEHIENHGVYLPLSTYPDGTEPSEPENFAEIRMTLRNRRPSLTLPPDLLEREYERFARLNKNAADEQLVIKSILPVLEGKEKDGYQTGAGHPFKELAPLTDGTLAPAQPDFYHGARPNQLKSAIRKQLKNQIIPTTKRSRPIAPNFFIEVKGHDGSILVATRQACYDGALGARAMHSLQQFGNRDYDNNAYAMASTYHAGCLGLYTIHPTRSRLNDDPDHRTDYVMTQVGQWALHGSSETYKQGLTAYRNARDLAKEQRDRFIKQANERYEADRRRNFTARVSVRGGC